MRVLHKLTAKSSSEFCTTCGLLEKLKGGMHAASPRGMRRCPVAVW